MGGTLSNYKSAILSQEEEPLLPNLTKLMEEQEEERKKEMNTYKPTHTEDHRKKETAEKKPYRIEVETVIFLPTEEVRKAVLNYLAECGEEIPDDALAEERYNSLRNLEGYRVTFGRER